MCSRREVPCRLEGPAMTPQWAISMVSSGARGPCICCSQLQPFDLAGILSLNSQYPPKFRESCLIRSWQAMGLELHASLLYNSPSMCPDCDSESTSGLDASEDVAWSDSGTAGPAALPARSSTLPPKAAPSSESRAANLAIS